MAANDSNTTRIAVLETTIIHIHEILERHEKYFDKIEQRFDKIDEKFDKVDQQFAEVRKNSMVQFYWIMGTIILGYFLPLILKLFHV